MAEETSIQTAEIVAARVAEERHWAMDIIGVAGVLGLCYWAEQVFVVTLISILLAFILAPVVDILMRIRLPRPLAAAIAVLLLIAAIGGICYYSANEALSFLEELPKYASTIREKVSTVTKGAETLRALGPAQEKGVVKVRTSEDWTDILTGSFGSVGRAILDASFVPFLVYFMLTWQQHVRSATVMLFPLENRHTAYVTLGLISAMIRSFMVGNVLIGLFI